MKPTFFICRHIKKRRGNSTKLKEFYSEESKARGCSDPTCSASECRDADYSHIHSQSIY